MRNQPQNHVCLHVATAVRGSRVEEKRETAKPSHGAKSLRKNKKTQKKQRQLGQKEGRKLLCWNSRVKATGPTQPGTACHEDARESRTAAGGVEGSQAESAREKGASLGGRGGTLAPGFGLLPTPPPHPTPTMVPRLPARSEAGAGPVLCPPGPGGSPSPRSSRQ